MSDVLTLMEPVVEPQRLTHELVLQKKSRTANLAGAERIIQSALSHPKLVEPLARVGFDSQELRQGLDLLVIVREKHAARREAMAVATRARKVHDAALATANQDYAEYWQTVQICYHAAERAILGACDIIPDATEQFCAIARKAYTKAQNQPFASTLGKHGFGPERLKSALERLDVLASADCSLQTAQMEAQAATDARDAAEQTFEDWMTRFHLLARVALRRSPTLVRQLIA